MSVTTHVPRTTSLLAASALGLGLLGLTGPTAYADPTAAPEAVSAERVTAAERCVQTTQAVSKAKRALRRAQRADHRRAAKVARAERRLEKRRARRNAACTAATGQQVLSEVQQAQLALGGLDTALLAGLLPGEAADGLTSLLAQLRAELERIAADVADGGSWGDFEALLADLDDLAPTDLATLLESLTASLGSLEASGQSLTPLLDLLLAGLPEGGALPGDLDDLAGLLATVVDALSGLGPDASPAELQALVAALLDGLPDLTDGLDTEAADLGVLLDLVSALASLGELDLTGADPAAQLATLLDAVLGMLDPGDQLGQLQDLLDLGALEDLIGLIGSLLPRA